MIRFRALKPHALLGFSLYKHHLHPDQIYIPLGKGNLVTRHHDANLTADIPDPVNEPDQWGILPGAKTLDQLLPSSAPAGDGPYLIYKPSQNLYEMRVDLEDASNLVLRLRAIGWSGLEGQHTSYTWDGWQTGDLELSWPRFLPDNLIVTQPADVALNVAPQAGYVQVRWDTEPDGCQGEAGGDFQPFVVFRRRGHSPNWKQISPLFRCISISSVAEEFHDTDVEDGFYYTYTVIQLDRMGEFTHRRGPTTVCYPAPGWCSGPVPD